jgi:hypothetical protein
MTKAEYAHDYSKAVYRETLELTGNATEALFAEMVAYSEAIQIWENSEGEEEVKDGTG